MTKSEFTFVRAELEREKNASPFYMAYRELPENWWELKREYERNGGIYVELFENPLIKYKLIYNIREFKWIKLDSIYKNILLNYKP